MLAQSILLSALVAAGALGAPASPRTGSLQPNWVVQVQDDHGRGRGRGRGGRDEGEQGEHLRSLRDIADELRARYGGELVDARPAPGDEAVYLIVWRDADGQLHNLRIDRRR